jgi:hypothetical protein
MRSKQSIGPERGDISMGSTWIALGSSLRKLARLTCQMQVLCRRSFDYRVNKGLSGYFVRYFREEVCIELWVLSDAISIETFMQTQLRDGLSSRPPQVVCGPLRLLFGIGPRIMRLEQSALVRHHDFNRCWSAVKMDVSIEKLFTLYLNSVWYSHV